MTPKSKAQWLKVGLLAVGVADCVGIYLVQQHLTQPVAEHPLDEAFVMAGTTTFSPAADSNPFDEVPTLAMVPTVPAPRVASPQEIAQVDLPLPEYGPAPQTSNDLPRAAKSQGGNATSLSHLFKPTARPVQMDLALPRMSAATPEVAPRAAASADPLAFSSAFATGFEEAPEAETGAPRQAELALEQSVPADTTPMAALGEAPRSAAGAVEQPASAVGASPAAAPDTSSDRSDADVPLPRL